MEKFFGKYRGTVIDNVDPMQMGRLQVQVADVSNVLPSTWAMPCASLCRHSIRLLCRASDRVGRLGGVRTRE